MNIKHSRICSGWIRHRRFEPKSHQFSYPVFMCWIDLDEVNDLPDQSPFWSYERFNLVSFYRRDYFGDPEETLACSISKHILEQTGSVFNGRISMLTNLRFLGFCFNPVSFYFCYPDNADYPRYIIAEINNTPWDERFSYLLDTENVPAKENCRTFVFSKAFHVSPFMPMDLLYRWRFNLSNKAVKIDMQLQRGDKKLFDATLQLEPQPLTSLNMWKIPLAYPFITLRVLFRIYWQALWLYLKGIPFYEHPDKKQTQRG